MKILVTGASGLLGSHITPLDSSLITPSLEELDVTNMASVEACFEKYKPDTVLHLAAVTNPPEHEKNSKPGLTVNIGGTVNIAVACYHRSIRLVYTASDYFYVGKGPHKEDEAIWPPNNFYISKLGGECAVRLCPNSLVLRLSFGPAPFPYEKVYEGQLVSKLYVDEMAPLILAAAKSTATGIMNLGGPAETLESYAKRTKPDVEVIPRPEWVPADLSLDISKMKQELAIFDEKSLLKH